MIDVYLPTSDGRTIIHNPFHRSHTYWNIPVAGDEDDWQIDWPPASFDLLEESPQGSLITGIAGKHFISQRKTFWRHNQSDDHLYAIRSLVTTVAKLPLIILSKRWIAFEISTG